MVSRKKKRTKLLSIFLPVLAVILLYIGVFIDSLPTPSTPLTFLIPENFQGSIKIINDESCGVDPAKEDGRILLEVPTTGLLIIKPEIKGDRSDHRYYFVDQDGKRTETIGKESLEVDSTAGVHDIGKDVMWRLEPDSVTYNAIRHVDLFVIKAGQTNYRITDTKSDSLNLLVAVDACRLPVK